jgi:hypothetical protein
MDQDSTFATCHLTHLIHTSHSPNSPTTKTIMWSPPWYFLSWFIHKTHVVATVPVFRALLPHCQEILESKFIHRFGKLSLSAEPRGHHNQAAECISPGKGQEPPFPGQNVISQTERNIPNEIPYCWN